MNMASELLEHSFVPRVSIARLPSCSYPAGPESDNPISQALHRVAVEMNWADENGPFGKVIPRGARGLIKPNLVLHRNEGSGGTECLVTHPSLIRAAVEAALRTAAAEVLVGDAPIQGCDFNILMQESGLQAWAQEQTARDPRFKGIQDFRRTTCVLVRGVRVAAENLQPADQFVLFNLGRESLLEPVSNNGNRFRVAWYDPRLMAKTHHAGVHEYLVAKAVIDADVIINLPKLKTHKKAGITCALKNLIGINGNKEYLPHHRVGGSAQGGDCYPGNGAVKSALEYVTDRQNLSSSYASATLWHLVFALLARTSRLQGDRLGTDGSWHGNDTIWRTCLDLNRILLYGHADSRASAGVMDAGTKSIGTMGVGTMKEEIQRRVIHIADAVIAGQGNGPLAPDPLELGFLLAGNNASAVDWVGARLLAYEPEKIPLLRHAFDQFRWPITNFSSGAVRVTRDLGNGVPQSVIEPVRAAVTHPLGWRTASAQTSEAQSSNASATLVAEQASTSQWDA
jgi:uncharacterized protein (DUF362 family)